MPHPRFLPRVQTAFKLREVLASALLKPDEPHASSWLAEPNKPLHVIKKSFGIDHVVALKVSTVRFDRTGPAWIGQRRLQAVIGPAHMTHKDRS